MPEEGGQVGQFAPVFGRSANFIPTRGGGADYAQQITTGPPPFPDFWTVRCLWAWFLLKNIFSASKVGQSFCRSNNLQGQNRKMIVFFFLNLTSALSFYRSQNVLAGPNFLCQTKDLLSYCGSHKHFVPDKKMICVQ